MPLTAQQAADKYGHRYQRYLHYRNVGDPMADAVVQALDGATTPEAHVMIRKAIEVGPAAVGNAPQALREFAEWARDVPYWVDYDMMRHGSELFTRNAALIPTIVSCMALPLGYSTQSAKTLYTTSVMSGYATKRLRETNRQIFEVGVRDGLQPGAAGWQICLQVRMIHAIIRNRIKVETEWDYANYGEPLHNVHLSMLAAVLGSYIIEGLNKLRRPMTELEQEGYITIWKYGGYLMGVEPELLTSSHAEGMRHLQLIFDCELDPSKESIALIHELFDSVGPVGQIEDPEQCKRVTGIVQSLTREFIGNEMADKLQLPHGHPHATHAAFMAIIESEKFLHHFGHLHNPLEELQVKMFKNLCLYSGDAVLDAFPLPSHIGDA